MANKVDTSLKIRDIAKNEKFQQLQTETQS
jgi:hypothetical protein